LHLVYTKLQKASTANNIPYKATQTTITIIQSQDSSN